MTSPRVLNHQVRVFVFRFENESPSFLLLRQQPRTENELGPIRGPVAVDEHLQDAVIREVREETGLWRPAHLIDLEQTTTFMLGNEGLVQWPFGYEAPAPDAREIKPGPTVCESIWVPFEHAFETLATPEDRSAL
ncbi:MAG: NUDIX hydrolase, partial [Planctomycetota bacterium]|nr:NUDIX hydrolase [Planctomycetota bacterium]